MFSESVAEIRRHEICLYTGGLRAGRVGCHGPNIPLLRRLCSFRSKISINLTFNIFAWFSVSCFTAFQLLTFDQLDYIGLIAKFTLHFIDLCFPVKKR